jgi:hypothetical protein
VTDEPTLAELYERRDATNGLLRGTGRSPQLGGYV